MRMILLSHIGLALWTLAGPLQAKPDHGASAIPESIWWQTGGEMSIHALEKKAAVGDARAKAQLASRILMTREEPYDADRVFRLFSESAKAGDALGNCGLAWCYAEGRGCPVDETLQFRHAKAAAETGFHHGAYQLGLCYWSGAGVEKDRKRAGELFRQAIVAGSPWAKRWLALGDYDKPAGRKAAIAALEELAATDFPPAIFDVGRLALSGRDARTSIEEIGRSARMGFVYAMAEYGNRLIKEKRVVEGADWLLEASERGNPYGTGELGKLVYFGYMDEGITGTRAASFRLLDDSLNHGSLDPDVAAKLAFHYCFGQGTKMDHAKAIAMIRRAWENFDRQGLGNYTHLSLSSSKIYSDVKPPYQDLAKSIAYARYCRYYDADSVGRVAWLYSLAGKDQPNDPVRAWAAVLTGQNHNFKSNTLAQAVKNLGGKLTPEQLQQAEALSEEGFPIKLQFRQGAARELGRPEPRE